jgi:hypothetical protein
MAFDLSALTAYTDEQSRDLLIASQFKSKTAQYATKHMKVKSSKNLHKIGGGIFFQDGTSCGWNASGGTDFTDRTLTTYPIKINEEYCIRDLEDYWTQILLNAGQEYSESDMPEAVRVAKLGEVMEAVETADWNGNTATGAGNNAFYNGIRKIISDAGTATEANVTAYYGTPATAISQSTVVGATDAMIKAYAATVPGNMGKTGNYIFMSRDAFMNLVFAYREKNYFGYNGTNDQGNDEMRILGTNITAIAVDGLNGVAEMYMFNTENFHIGMDGEGEEDAFITWYQPKEELVYMKLRFRRGVQFAYPEEVVTFIV